MWRSFGSGARQKQIVQFFVVNFRERYSSEIDVGERRKTYFRCRHIWLRILHLSDPTTIDVLGRDWKRIESRWRSIHAPNGTDNRPSSTIFLDDVIRKIPLRFFSSIYLNLFGRRQRQFQNIRTEWHRRRAIEWNLRRCVQFGDVRRRSNRNETNDWRDVDISSAWRVWSAIDAIFHRTVEFRCISPNDWHVLSNWKDDNESELWHSRTDGGITSYQWSEVWKWREKTEILVE